LTTVADRTRRCPSQSGAPNAIDPFARGSGQIGCVTAGTAQLPKKMARSRSVLGGKYGHPGSLRAAQATGT